MLATHLDKGLVGALHDALAADVDPAAGGHLAVHHQALAIELVEVLPGGPVRDEVGVGDEHARGVGVGGEDADGLAGLHEQGFVVAKVLQLSMMAGAIDEPSMSARLCVAKTTLAFFFRSVFSHSLSCRDRKSVVSGQRVSVRVDLGGRGCIKKKKYKK